MNKETEEVVIADQAQNNHAAVVLPITETKMVPTHQSPVKAQKTQPREAVYAHSSYLDIPFIDETEDEDADQV